MVGSLNKVIIIGNLGRDPEIRKVSNDKEIVNLNVATSETWTDRNTGEKKERTEWHRVVIFNEGLVNVVKNYARKGTKVYIEGSLQTRKWVDGSNQEKYTTEIVLQGINNNQFILLDNKNSTKNDKPTLHNQSTGPIQDNSQHNNFDHNKLDDDIPF